MDACVRHGIWLNISLPWETEAEELWPCYENVRPGSYFPGTGMAIFNTSGGNVILSVDMGAHLHPFDTVKAFRQAQVFHPCMT